MYEDLIFAADKKGIHTTDVSEATDAASNLNITHRNITLGELDINENASIGEQKITKFGFENFCKILGIPKPFARMIPPDLLFTNIKRLQNTKQGMPLALLERDNQEIANIIKVEKKPYREPSYLDMLSAIADRDDLKYINLNEKLMTVCLNFKDKYILGQDENDFLYVGSFMYGSSLRVIPLSINSGLFRTLCENSFVMPFLGTAKANYKIEDNEQMLLAFTDLVRCYDNNLIERIQKNSERIKTRNVFDKEWTSIWKGINNLLGTGEADTLLHVSEEERKTVVKNVGDRRVENKRSRLLGEAIEEDTLMSVKAYDVLNNMTSKAKDLFGEEKRTLEKLSGKWFEEFFLN